MPLLLKPFNRHEIFSQIEPVDMLEYDLDDSFVVDEINEEEITDNNEMSELEIAEAILEAKRKEKKRKRR